MPFSLRINAVKSFGNPKVSYNSNAFSPEILFLSESKMTLSNNCKPRSKVRKNDASSSRITLVTNCCCDLISGKNSPIWSAKTSTNLFMKGSLIFKNVNP